MNTNHLQSISLAELAARPQLLLSPSTARTSSKQLRRIYNHNLDFLAGVYGLTVRQLESRLRFNAHFA